MINAYNWYWSVASESPSTQVFSSASGTYVPLTNATYEASLATSPLGRASPIANEQELLTVLQQQAPGVVMQTPTGLAAYANAKQNTIASGGISVSVGTSTAPQSVEASTSTANLILLQGAAALAQANSSATFQWVQSNGVAITLTATQVLTILSAVQTFLQQTFTTLAGVLAAITAGTITTQAQVDTPPSPIPAWPVNS
jgi:hypothetical protein